MSTYICDCPNNYTGKHCEIYLGFESTCENNPCMNDFECSDKTFNKKTGEEVFAINIFTLWFGHPIQYQKNHQYCKAYECEPDYECSCNDVFDQSNWTGKNCEVWEGEPCLKEMATFEDQQNCINDLVKKIDKIENGKFTFEMKRKMKKLSGKK